MLPKVEAAKRQINERFNNKVSVKDDLHAAVAIKKNQETLHKRHYYL